MSHVHPLKVVGRGSETQFQVCGSCDLKLETLLVIPASNEWEMETNIFAVLCGINTEVEGICVLHYYLYVLSENICMRNKIQPRRVTYEFNNNDVCIRESLNYIIKLIYINNSYIKRVICTVTTSMCRSLYHVFVLNTAIYYL